MKHTEHSKNLIRAWHEAKGHAQMRRLLEIVGVGPCRLTDEELSQQLGISDRMVRKYLKRLIDYGMLSRRIEHFSMPGVIRSSRILMPSEAHAVPESEERSEVDAEPGTDPAKGHQ